MNTARLKATRLLPLLIAGSLSLSCNVVSSVGFAQSSSVEVQRVPNKVEDVSNKTRTTVENAEQLQKSLDDEKDVSDATRIIIEKLHSQLNNLESHKLSELKKSLDVVRGVSDATRTNIDKLESRLKNLESSQSDKSADSCLRLSLLSACQGGQTEMVPLLMAGLMAKESGLLLTFVVLASVVAVALAGLAFKMAIQKELLRELQKHQTELQAQLKEHQTQLQTQLRDLQPQPQATTGHSKGP